MVPQIHGSLACRAGGSLPSALRDAENRGTSAEPQVVPRANALSVGDFCGTRGKLPDQGQNAEVPATAVAEKARKPHGGSPIARYSRLSCIGRAGACQLRRGVTHPRIPVPLAPAATVADLRRGTRGGSPASRQVQASEGGGMLIATNPTRTTGPRGSVRYADLGQFQDAQGSVVLCEEMPNNQFQRSVNSRLRRLSPPAELGRWASVKWLLPR